MPPKKPGIHFSPAKIKKMMQSNEDIPKIANAVPALLAKALDMMTREFLEKCTEGFSFRFMTPSHVKRCVHVYSKYNFAEKFVANVPSLQNDDNVIEKPGKQPTMRRVSADASKKPTENVKEKPKRQKRIREPECNSDLKQVKKKRGRPRKELHEVEETRQPVISKKSSEISKAKDDEKANHRPTELSLILNQNEEIDTAAEEEQLRIALSGQETKTAYEEDDDYDS